MSKATFTFTQIIFCAMFSVLFFRATAQKSICVAKFKPEDVCYGSTVRKIIKHHNVSKDSLTQIIEQKILSGIKARVPGSGIVLADEKMLQIIADSSEIEHMLTTSHEQAIVGKDGFERIKIRASEISTFYFGREFTEGGKVQMNEILQKSGVDYFVLLSDFEGKGQFRIQFEVYDKNFTKLYGDKFERSQKISKEMYFDAFLFHLDSYLQGFNDELAKQLH